MVTLARSRGFEFMSNQYKGIVCKHTWRCFNGHIWEAKPNSIKNGTGCPICARSKLRKTLDDMNLLAKSKRFEFLSNQFYGTKKKHLWKCINGHTWETTPTHIRSGTGCPICQSNPTEEMVRHIFESLLNTEFRKTRKVLGGLELDGYSRKLHMAFEYNGPQHYDRNHYYNRIANSKHLSTFQRDTMKKEMCEKLGISLIEVSHKYQDRLETHISNQLKKLGHTKLGKVNWNKFSIRRHKLDELRGLADKKGGRLLSNCYYGSHAKHCFLCFKCKHVWSSRAKDILQKNSWCPNCSGNKKYSRDDVQQIAEKNNWFFLSLMYEGMNVKHTFSCRKCGYFCECTPNKIQQGKRCPQCRKEVQ